MANLTELSTETLDLVAFGPHPDDVELFCGGVMLAMADRGYRTGIVDLTWGERASQGTKETRIGECELASGLMKLHCRTNLELPDTLLPPLAWAVGAYGGENLSKPTDAGCFPTGIPQEVEAALAKLVTVIRGLRPRVVVIPPSKERHPDHVAAHYLITQALFYAQLRNFPHAESLPPFQPDQMLVYPMRVELTPSFIVDTSHVVERKRELVHCYRSQVTRQVTDGSNTEISGTLLSSSLAMSVLETRDKMAGARIGTAAGEPYISVNTLGLIDPLDHFRRNPFHRPHLFAAVEF